MKKRLLVACVVTGVIALCACTGDDPVLPFGADAGIDATAPDAAGTDGATDGGASSDADASLPVDAGACGVLAIDGGSATLPIDRSDAQPSLTIEAWVNPTAVLAGKTYEVLDRSESSPGIGAGTFSIRIVDRVLELRTNCTFGGAADTLTSTVPLVPGAWVHVAAVFSSNGTDPGAISLFVNGVRETPITAGCARLYTTVEPLLRVARNEPSTERFSGRIDEVRLSRVARYTAAVFTPAARHVADADTLALYHFGEVGQTAPEDSSTSNLDGGAPRRGSLVNNGPSISAKIVDDCSR
jgi:Concanavalin A-like lectin/glucanases superfamily